MNQRDWYLAQCDITQYILRKSAAFKGELATQLSDQIRLIVVAKQKPTEKIYWDILSAISLNEQQVLFLTPSQLILSAQEVSAVTWFLGTQLPDSWQEKSNVIITQELDKLAYSSNQKRQLWQQLCNYEHHFNTQNS